MGQQQGQQPLVSLIVATVGRTDELRRLLASLSECHPREFEVIVVDQNSDDRLVPVLRDAADLDIRRLHLAGRLGVCRARNVGLECARADLVAFPDDDCWYPSDFFAAAIGRLGEGGFDGVTGRAADGRGRSINGRFATEPAHVSRSNAFTTQIEWTSVLSTSAVRAVGGFREDLGPGAGTPWRSCEGVDLDLRLIAEGFDLFFDPKLYAHHDEVALDRPGPAERERGRSYGRGLGYVLRAHQYPPWHLAYWVARPLANLLWAVARGRFARARYFAAVALGRSEGYLRRCLPRTRID